MTLKVEKKCVCDVTPIKATCRANSFLVTPLPSIPFLS